MASFTVTLPNGSSYDVEGLPDDATESDALAAVLAQHPEAADADNSLQQWLGVATRALLPYGVAAAGGAAAGAPFAGVGAVPGAAAGVLALGAGDIGTGIYNLAATPFGAPRMALPSETIRQAYESAGLPGTREPVTPEQRIFSAGLEAATGAGGTARALTALAPTLRAGSTARGVVTELGRGARAQTAGGAGAGGLTQTAVESGETDPLKLFLISLAGGVGGTLAGGRTPRPTITGTDVREQARRFYQQMEREGVFFSPQAADDLANRLENTLVNLRGATIAREYRTAIEDQISNLRNRNYPDLSFEELETIRSNLGLIGRDAMGLVRPNTPGAQANRLAGVIQDDLDDFVLNAGPAQVTAGDPQVAANAVRQARRQWQNARKGEILEQVLTRTERSGSTRPKIEELQKRLEPIVNNDRLMAKFTPDEQEVLRSLQRGSTAETVLSGVGQLAPDLKTGLGVTKAAGYLGAIPAAAALVDPTAAVTTGMIGGAALASRAMANRMALRRASDVAENVLSGRPPATRTENALRATGRGAAYVPPVVLGSQAVNNAFLTDAYGNQYDAQGNMLR
jgi:hypothetical protein